MDIEMILMNSVNENTEMKESVIKAIDEYKISFDTLSIISGICKEKIISLYNGMKVKIESDKIMHLYAVFVHLFDLLPIGPDYTKAIIETLFDMFEISYETIAIFTSVEATKIKSYYEEDKQLSDVDFRNLTEGAMHIYAAITKSDRAFGEE